MVPHFLERKKYRTVMVTHMVEGINNKIVMVVHSIKVIIKYWIINDFIKLENLELA